MPPAISLRPDPGAYSRLPRIPHEARASFPSGTRFVHGGDVLIALETSVSEGLARLTCVSAARRVCAELAGVAFSGPVLVRSSGAILVTETYSGTLFRVGADGEVGVLGRAYQDPRPECFGVMPDETVVVVDRESGVSFYDPLVPGRPLGRVRPRLAGVSMPELRVMEGRPAVIVTDDESVAVLAVQRHGDDIVVRQLAFFEDRVLAACAALVDEDGLEYCHLDELSVFCDATVARLDGVDEALADLAAFPPLELSEAPRLDL